MNRNFWVHLELFDTSTIKVDVFVRTKNANEAYSEALKETEVLGNELVATEIKEVSGAMPWLETDDPNAFPDFKKPSKVIKTWTRDIHDYFNSNEESKYYNGMYFEENE